MYDFNAGDALGPAKLIQVFEPGLGLKAALVVDNVARGPAVGGLRMAPDVSLEECSRLARAMTLKNSAAGLPHGGAKSVLWGDPRMPREGKERLIRAFAHALRNETDYIFGPDMGTDEACMAWVKDEIGRAAGLPAALGGIPLNEIGATGWGVYHCADVAAQFCGLKLEGARVAVQGFGAVGKHAARFLAERGTILVAASDSHGTLYDSAGIDVAALIGLKDRGGSVCDAARGDKLGRDAVIGIECDILIPAARPDVVRGDNVDKLRTRLVLQGANIPFTAEAERALHARGVTVVPDFIANAGGVICAAMEYAGATQRAAFDAIGEKIRVNTEAVLREAKKQGRLPREAAVDLATRRVREAMSLRRFSIM
ncbi:MAG: Glu/Leu/Phe/Val dehydrogenase [Betaproteobacteria bacterium]|nr:Glu/Leu/Phe/Val dehydrogenase [Betaproteobacteria bacterium]